MDLTKSALMLTPWEQPIPVLTRAPGLDKRTKRGIRMKISRRNQLVAGAIGAAMLLAPTAAFADATPSPTATTTTTNAKPTADQKAAYKAALDAYRVALKAWQQTRDSDRAAYKTALAAYRAAIAANKASRQQIDATFNSAVAAARAAYATATAGSPTAAARQVALNARVAEVAAATNARAAAIAALPTLPARPSVPTVAPKPTPPVKP